MSIRVLDRVFKTSRSRNGARLVLLALADYSDDAGRSYPSRAGIARKANLSERPIDHSLQWLVKAGELAVDVNAGPNGCNVYRILLPPVESTPPVNLTPPVESAATPRRIDALPPVKSAPEPSGTVIEPSKSIDRAKALSRSPAASRVKFPVGSLQLLYLAYPRKKAPVTAHKAIRKALDTLAKRGTPDPVEWLLERVQTYAKSREGEDQQFTPYPATWFNAGSYDDDFNSPASGKKLAKDYFANKANREYPEPVRSPKFISLEDEPAEKPVW